MYYVHIGAVVHGIAAYCQVLEQVPATLMFQVDIRVVVHGMAGRSQVLVVAQVLADVVGEVSQGRRIVAGHVPSSIIKASYTQTDKLVDGSHGASTMGSKQVYKHGVEGVVVTKSAKNHTSYR